MHIGDVLRG